MKFKFVKYLIIPLLLYFNLISCTKIISTQYHKSINIIELIQEQIKLATNLESTLNTKNICDLFSLKNKATLAQFHHKLIANEIQAIQALDSIIQIIKEEEHFNCYEIVELIRHSQAESTFIKSIQLLKFEDRKHRADDLTFPTVQRQLFEKYLLPKIDSINGFELKESNILIYNDLTALMTIEPSIFHENFFTLWDLGKIKLKPIAKHKF